jgi:hypothetical protein
MLGPGLGLCARGFGKRGHSGAGTWQDARVRPSPLSSWGSLKKHTMPLGLTDVAIFLLPFLLGSPDVVILARCNRDASI